MRTKARREGDEYVLDGSKRFITNAGVADLYTVFAETDRDRAPRHRAFVVETDTPGFAVARLEPKMGICGSPTGSSPSRVPHARREPPRRGGRRLQDRDEDARPVAPGIAAQALGIAQGALDYATEYTKQRVAIGKPISQQQGMQFKLADMKTEVEAARLLLYDAARKCDEGARRRHDLAAMAKLKCGDIAMSVTTDAVQVLGGYGYSRSIRSSA